MPRRRAGFRVFRFVENNVLNPDLYEPEIRFIQDNTEYAFLRLLVLHYREKQGEIAEIDIHKIGRFPILFSGDESMDHLIFHSVTFLSWKIGQERN